MVKRGRLERLQSDIADIFGLSCFGGPVDEHSPGCAVAVPIHGILAPWNQTADFKPARVVGGEAQTRISGIIVGHTRPAQANAREWRAMNIEQPSADRAGRLKADRKILRRLSLQNVMPRKVTLLMEEEQLSGPIRIIAFDAERLALNWIPRPLEDLATCDAARERLSVRVEQVQAALGSPSCLAPDEDAHIRTDRGQEQGRLGDETAHPVHVISLPARRRLADRRLSPAVHAGFPRVRGDRARDAPAHPRRILTRRLRESDLARWPGVRRVVNSKGEPDVGWFCVALLRSVGILPTSNPTPSGHERGSPTRRRPP